VVQSVQHLHPTWKSSLNRTTLFVYFFLILLPRGKNNFVYSSKLFNKGKDGGVFNVQLVPLLPQNEMENQAMNKTLTGRRVLVETMNLWWFGAPSAHELALKKMLLCTSGVRDR
jgi:hypothetical protein